MSREKLKYNKMKSLTFVIMTLLLSSFTIKTYSQSSLEFNQVKLISTEETVPNNKVWKIVSVAASSNLALTGGGLTKSQSTQIIVNSQIVHVTQVSSWVGDSSGSNANPRPHGITSIQITNLPMWLPEGSTLQSGINVNHISVIEFNLVQ